MTKKSKAQDEDEGKAKITCTTHVDYVPYARVGGRHDEAESNSAGARLSATLTAIRHMQAIFMLLATIDGEKLNDLSGPDLEVIFEGIGELGSQICNSAYSHVEEAWRELPE